MREGAAEEGEDGGDKAAYLSGAQLSWSLATPCTKGSNTAPPDASSHSRYLASDTANCKLLGQAPLQSDHCCRAKLCQGGDDGAAHRHCGGIQGGDVNLQLLLISARSSAVFQRAQFLPKCLLQWAQPQ